MEAPLLFCLGIKVSMGSLEAPSYLRHIQNPDWNQDITRDSHYVPGQQLAVMGTTLVPRLPLSPESQGSLKPLLSSLAFLEQEGIRAEIPSPLQHFLSALCVWREGGSLLLACFVSNQSCFRYSGRKSHLSSSILNFY